MRTVLWLSLVAALLAARVTVHAGGAPPSLLPGRPAGAVLMDVRTGRVLYAADMHRRLRPASTTKILTAIIAIERLPSNTTVTISAEAAAERSGSSIGLEIGERWAFNDLLYATVLRSANDAALALAAAVAGSTSQFVELMNAKARRIGATSSHFANPHGLDHPDHYTTAHDLAQIARYALLNRQFAMVAGTQTRMIQRPGKPPEEIVSLNRFLGRFPGADGVKTGFTAAAGRTLVASATRNGWQLVAVLLRSDEIVGDAERLLEYGFATYAPVRVASSGETLATHRVADGGTRVVAVVPADVNAVVRRGATLATRVTWRDGLVLPIAAGTRIGNVEFLDGPSIVARSPLVAARPVPR